MSAHSSPTPVSIVHVLRAPVGGLFRHVIDLSREQAARGCRVGVIADSSTGGARAEELFRVRGTPDPLRPWEEATLREPPGLSPRDQHFFDSFKQLIFKI